MKSSATTVTEYLDSLPADRRETIEAVREVILKHVPKGYEEAINWSVISYQIPLERYPTTYNKQPLMYAGLASQKNYCALYLMGVYGSKSLEEELRTAFAKEGKKLSMGKSCIRFKSVDDLPLNAIGNIIARCSVEKYIEIYESSRKKNKGSHASHL